MSNDVSAGADGVWPSCPLHDVACGYVESVRYVDDEFLPPMWECSVRDCEYSVLDSGYWEHG